MPFNPHMLVIARTMAGMTQLDLERAAGTSQATISKLEGGLGPEPSAVLLDAFARALGVRPSFFSRPGERRPLPLVSHYRKAETLPKKPEHRLEAIFNVRRMDVAQLLRSVDLEPAATLPEPPDEMLPITGRPPMAQVARQTRAALGVPSGPILDMVAVLERAGVVVVFVKDIHPKWSGISAPASDGAPPMVFVNADHPGDRVAFTLAHELGHLVLHARAASTTEVEDEADEFAADFLMPADEIRPQLHRLTFHRLVDLKEYWRVSIGALIKRAETLRTMPPEVVTNFWRGRAKRGWVKTEPGFVPRPPARLLGEIVDTHLEIGFTDEELAEVVGLPTQKFLESYAPHRLRSLDGGGQSIGPKSKPKLHVVR